MYMVDGRVKERWSHTSALLTLIANCNRDTTKRPTPFTLADFNPYAEPQDEPTGDWSMLQRICPKRGKR